MPERGAEPATLALYDAVIFGGGIAGLWTLARLRQAGYRAILLESDRLGGIQTIAAQGIIHGGTKYALEGKLSGSACAIGDMPGLWRECLGGQGELDLNRVRVLSHHQHLWSTGELTSRMAGFFAGKLMRSRMELLEGAQRPEPFRSPQFKGNLYRLEEPVVDVPSLIAELVRRHGEACYAYAPESLCCEPGSPHRLSINGTQFGARRLILTAGAGNQALLTRLGRDTPNMQRRPLHLLLVRGRLPQLYAHCLGAGPMPRLTISSYPLESGETVWHLGGQVAESGVEREEEEHIASAEAELKKVLPWLDITGVRWSTRRIDRAEIASPGNKRPERWFVDSNHGIITAWPTKMAFAPYLAAEVQERLEGEGIHPSGQELSRIEGLENPGLRPPPWDEQ